MTNVTPIESKQPAPAAKFHITATLEGFPVVIEAEGKADDLRALVARLKAIGATPPTPIGVKAEPTNNDDAPVCEYHGAMRQGRHGWFCPKKMGDGSYCKSKA
jgi:hypothetical protein